MTNSITDRQAERQIVGAFLEIAATIEWLANKEDLHHTFWAPTFRQLTATQRARQLYLEGEFDQAVQALPEF